VAMGATGRGRVQLVRAECHVLCREPARRWRSSIALSRPIRKRRVRSRSACAPTRRPNSV
jgi:hypothetical protein